MGLENLIAATIGLILGSWTKFKAMNTFVGIVEAGSLTAAAERLGMSLAAVVRSLAALEESSACPAQPQHRVASR